MKRTLFALLFAILATHALADTKISALPVGTTLNGTEAIPMVQPGQCPSTGGTCQTSPGAVYTFVKNQGIPLSSLPTQANNSFLGNVSGGMAVPGVINPLAAANMMSAMFSVRAMSTANVSLTGLQTIDGVSLGVGDSVLLTNQTTSSQNGLWIVQSGAWIRAVNFPSGYVIAQSCDIAVFIREGTVRQGHTFRLATSSSSITIDTTNQAWSDSQFTKATTTVAGLIFSTENVSGTSTPAAIVENTSSTREFDCTSFATVGGSISDIGNSNGTLGPCVVADANGHPILDAVGVPPGVTGTGCSLVVGGTDNHGAITATGVDNCTLTFGGGFTTAPYCGVAGENTTVLPSIGTRPTTSAVIFKTAAAGTFEYLCL